MKREYDMTGATRATEVEHLNRLRSGKTRITILLDNDVLEDFRARAEQQGTGYQTAINLALREYLSRRPIDEETLRRVPREELHAA
ncbi:MAG: BrnA antitoxin family protein [bacterium]